MNHAKDEKNFYQELGERLLAMRKTLGISESEAAEAIGAGLKTYRKWETGRKMRCWAWDLRDYCAAFGVSYNWLQWGEGNFLPDDDDYLSDLRSWKEIFGSKGVISDAGRPFVASAIVKH
jgi:transcriptional regulator with XRE-family HTH domain